MPPESTTSILGQVREIALAAGRSILAHYGSQTSVAKADASPLTEADRAAHAVIVPKLSVLIPDMAVISEEGDPALFESPPTGDFWLVDPLDGTKEFLKQTGHFTVNIAWIHDAEPVLGVVHAPARGLTYWADPTSGAWRLAEGAAPTRIHTRALPGHPVRIVASRDHAGPDEARFFARFPGAETVSIGSSLKFCLVAEGAADFYPRFGPTMEWDTAAAHAVLRLAGGRLETLDERPLRYGKSTLRNPAFLAIGDAAWNRSGLSA